MKKLFIMFLLFVVLIAKANNEDFTFIIFGATGDLASRDLIPSLYRLYEQNKFSRFALIGAALQDNALGDILLRSKEFLKQYNEDAFNNFASNCYYVQLDLNVPTDYKKLLSEIKNVEQKLNLSGNRLFYCATSCSFYETITINLEANDIIKNKSKLNEGVWHRIIYEKPFGFDYDSANQMQKTISNMLDDDQIIYMDHFLFTQAINYICSLRFDNLMFKKIWSHKYIESIQILFNETLSVGTRGKMYDQIGALLDVVQNHMFQMLALAAIDEPKEMTFAQIKNEKKRILANVRFVDGFLGQYNGYNQESGVPNDSKTETFTALKFYIDTSRWQNVPFYLISGKCLDKTEICIRLLFKPNKNGERSIFNVWLAPKPSYELVFNVQKIDDSSSTMFVDWNYEIPKHDTYSIETYKTILEKAIFTPLDLSVDFDEIQLAWKIINQIKSSNIKLYNYDKYTNGPNFLIDFYNK